MTLIIGNLEPSTSAFDAEPSTAQYIGAILTMIDGLRSKVAFYAYDANGNVTDLVGTNGQFLAQYQFDPYGNTISKTGALADVNPFRFSTKYTDSETGLLYYGHRYFMPEIGRWASRDPLTDYVSYLAALKNKSQKERRIITREAIRSVYRFGDNSTIGYDALGLVWGASLPDPTINTIVCDGKGGVKIQLTDAMKNNPKCIVDCANKHEESHKADALADNPDVCKDMPDDFVIFNTDQNEVDKSEVKAADAEIACLAATKPSAECPKCFIDAARKQMEKWKKDHMPKKTASGMG